MAKQTQLTVKDLAVIQKYLCKALAEPGSRMTTSDIYLQTKDAVDSTLEAHYFRTSLSERIKDGTLAGLVIKKGRYGGVSIEDLAAARDTAEALEEKAEKTPDMVLLNGGWVPVLGETEAETETVTVHAGSAARAERKANALIIRLTKNLRIYPLDKLNWSVQKLAGTNAVGEENWASDGYYSTLDQALNGAARGMLDKRLRAASTTITDLQDLRQVVQDAQAAILKEISIEVHKNIDKG